MKDTFDRQQFRAPLWISVLCQTPNKSVITTSEKMHRSQEVIEEFLSSNKKLTVFM